MKIEEIYKLAIEKGIENDPRGKERIEKILSLANKKFDELKDKEKEFFDKEDLTNPYSDTRIFVDDKREVKKILCGIDIEAAEILLADRLNEKGEKIDLVLAHHPEGKAYANISAVMDMQADVAHSFGVPINIAEGVHSSRIGEVFRRVQPVNHSRPVDTAKILKINYMNIHTPADNSVQKYLQEIFDKKQPEKVSDVLDILKEIQEYKEATKLNAGPVVFAGSPDRRAGKVMVDMTGGTEGAKEIYKKLSDAGVGTIVGMHVSEEHKKEAEENHINIVIAGHIASDSIGMNLILDKLEEKGIEIVPCSGLIRIKRTK